MRNCVIYIKAMDVYCSKANSGPDVHVPSVVNFYDDLLTSG